MSATESAYSNDLVLGYDPLVKEGLNEEAMVTVVLPYVKTAREGVQRLGELVAKYGTGETNGILFADDDEAGILRLALVTTGLPSGFPMTAMLSLPIN